MTKYKPIGGIENSKGLILMQFSLKGCQRCGMLNVMLRKLQEEYDNKFEYHEIIAMSDRKEHPLAKQYGIYSVPTLIVFKDGKIILQEVYPEYERIKNLIEVEINGKGNDEERKEDVSACKA